MTLTLETAELAVGKYGEIFYIVDDVNDLDARSVTREEAIEGGKTGYPFTPCIVVTTAREALEAAWELAYETTRIPARTPYIFRAPGTDIQATKGQPGELYAGHGRSRLIDPPTPKREPWELSRYCHASGDIYKRLWNANTVYWMCPGDETAYRREDLAKLNPQPLDLE